MTDPGIPPAVVRFLTDHIASVAQLEILILMHGRADEDQTPESVARELRVDAAWAATELEHLVTSGVLAVRAGPVPAYRFAPRTPELAHAVKETIDTYTKRRVSVVNFIFGKPSANIRVFADAFRIRKD
jgi:hypothetical protein